MEFGVVMMPVDPWPTTAERARELEEMGFDHLWVYDHLSWKHYRDRPWHATTPWLTGLAATTERIGLGTLVISPSIRHPLLVAKEAMSIDHISRGRLILGIGAGGTGFDATAYGQEPLTSGERTDRLGEYLSVTDGLLRGTLTEHQGRWYTVDGGRVLPGCLQSPRVPLAVAAGGPRTIAMAARVADTWITLGDTASAPSSLDHHIETLATQAKLLDEACHGLGRDPATIGRISFVGLGFDAPVANPEAFARFVASMEELGFTAVVIHDRRSDDPGLDIDPDVLALAGSTATDRRAAT